MAELYTTRPLFPGSSESDQLFKICSVVGTPSQTGWPEGHRLAGKINFRFPRCVATDLGTLVPQAGPDALDCMNGSMQWDPNHRLSAARCLQHPYFASSSLATGSENPAAALPQLPRPSSKSEVSRAMDKYAPRPPSGIKAKPSDLPPIQPSQGRQQDWAGNFLLNNLNSSKGIEGHGADARSRVVADARAAVGGGGNWGGGLPALGVAQKDTPGSGKNQKTPESRGSSRYLRMARYQPGMQQTPVVAASNMRLPGIAQAR